MFDIGIKRVAAIVARALYMFGLVFFFFKKKKRRRGALKKIASGQGTRPFLSRC